MLAVIRTTWCAALMFVVSIVGVGVALGWMDPRGAWINVMIVVLITMPTWWWLIGRRRDVGLIRGALVGALCAALVFLVPIVSVILTMLVRGFGQGDGVIGIMALAGMLATAIPIGAAVGTISVVLQRRLFV